MRPYLLFTLLTLSTSLYPIDPIALEDVLYQEALTKQKGDTMLNIQRQLIENLLKYDNYYIKDTELSKLGTYLLLPYDNSNIREAIKDLELIATLNDELRLTSDPKERDELAKLLIHLLSKSYNY